MGFGDCPEQYYDTVAVFDGHRLWLGSTATKLPAAPGRIADPGTGRILGTFRGDPPAFAPDGTGLRVLGGALVAFDPRTLQERWRLPGIGYGSAPLVTGSLVAIVGEDGVLHVLDVATGQERYRYAGPPPEWTGITTGLSAGDRHLVVPSGEGLEAFAADPEPEPAGPSGTAAGDATSPPPSSGAVLPPADAPAMVGGTSTAARPARTSPPRFSLDPAVLRIDGRRRLLLRLRCTGGRGHCRGHVSVRLARGRTVTTAALAVPSGSTITVVVPLPRSLRRRTPTTVGVRLGSRRPWMRARVGGRVPRRR